MEQLLEKLKPFILSPDDKIKLKDNNFNHETDFISNISFDKDSKKEINKNENLLKSGLYFWVFIINGIEYKLYIGSAGSGISRRLCDYLKNEFQPSSANDYKIHFFNDYFFYEFAIKLSYKVYFSFYENYFTEKDSLNMTLFNWETQLRNNIKPVIFDNTHHFKGEIKKEIENSFKTTYSNYFKKIIF